MTADGDPPAGVLLKLSGEVLSGDGGTGLDPAVLQSLAGVLSRVSESGRPLAVVPGGGNFFRGRERGLLDRVAADRIGMMGTLMNGLALESVLRASGVPCLLTSAVAIPGIATGWDPVESRAAWRDGRVVICAGGTGNPYLTTDTAAALRALQLGAGLLMKGTKVDGVYSEDPTANPGAERFESISFEDYLRMGLGVMDTTAVALCRQEGLPIVVFDIVSSLDNIERAMADPEGTGSMIGGNRSDR